MNRKLALTTALAFGMFAGAAQAATIVLVHGAFQTAAAWDDVKPLLAAKGRKVIAVNLPGRNSDTTPVKEITLDAYRQAVQSAIKDEAEPVILVGHSAGGLTISAVAESAPKKVKALVYLAAYLPRSGDSVASLAQTDGESTFAVKGNFVVSADQTYASVNDAVKAETFANDAGGATRNAIVSSLIREPLAPLATPVTLGENFRSVPKYYIKTTLDHCVGPALQSKMAGGGQLTKLYEIKAGHAPYKTKPAEVAALIAEIAN